MSDLGEWDGERDVSDNLQGLWELSSLKQKKPLNRSSSAKIC